MTESASPGRARRLWLEGRLRWARRAVDLLDSKRHALLIEDGRMSEGRQRTALQWEATSREARTWATRAAASSGTWAIWVAASSLGSEAAITVTTGHAAGVAHPAAVDLRVPELAAVSRVAAGPVVAQAADAHGRALRAAAAHAATDAAYRLVHAELEETERRQRAIERIRIPALESELATLVLRLDELEREERVISRWASVRSGHRDWPT